MGVSKTQGQNRPYHLDSNNAAGQLNLETLSPAEPQQPKTGEHVRWQRIVALLTAGWIVIWIYRSALTPIYPILSDYFGGVSDAALGSISSFYFLGYVAMQIPAGFLVNHLGQRRVAIPGFALFGIGTVIVAMAKVLPTLYFGGFLAGLGCGTFYGCAYSLTAIYVPNNHASLATAIVNSGSALGSGIGLVSSSYLVGSGFISWQVFIFLTTLLIAGMIAALCAIVPKPKYVESGTKMSASNSTAHVGIPAIFKPQMLAAYILYAATIYAFYLIDTWLPNFLELERGFAGTAVGLASSLVFFAGVPGALVFSRIADEVPHKKIPLILCLEIASALALVLIIQAPNQALLVACVFAYGFFGKLAIEPLLISWLSRFSKEMPISVLYGVFNFFGMSASIAAPAITGAISDVTGSKAPSFYLAAVLIICATILFFTFNRKALKT